MSISHSLLSTCADELARCTIIFSLFAACQTGEPSDLKSQESGAGSASEASHAEQSDDDDDGDGDGDGDDADDNDDDNDDGDDDDDEPEGDDTSDSDNATGDGESNDEDFEPLSVRAALAKVKSLLTGLPASETEVARVEADRDALGDLIDEWMTLPEFDRELLGFFEHHFQQKPVPVDEYDIQAGGVLGSWQPSALAPLLEAFSLSLPQTALDIVHDGRPFTETLTTRTYYMSNAMLMYYAFIDGYALADDSSRSQPEAWLNVDYPDLNITLYDAAQQTIPLTDSLDPKSVNFMKFALEFRRPPEGKCLDILGTPLPGDFKRLMRVFGGNSPNCPPLVSPLLAAQDHVLRPITVRKAQAGEPKVPFWDLYVLRELDELALVGDHVSFFTTPAFFANWPSNLDNAHRVTANQALIVALRHNLQDESELPFEPFSDDEDHADPSSDCYGCHVVLDPLRNFYRHSVTTNYAPRMTQMWQGEPLPDEASFYIGGTTPPVIGFGIRDLAGGMASHPTFSWAWALKLCKFANSGFCQADDPLLEHMANDFADEGHDFKRLLRDVLSSPLVTFWEPTDTWREYGIAMSIARREEFCSRLSNRLDIADVCNLRHDHTLFPDEVVDRLTGLATGVPAHEYARGTVDSVLVADPSLFSFSASERFCDLIASRIIGANEQIYTPDDVPAALNDFVHKVMGVPQGDPLAASMRSLLTEHYDKAQTIEDDTVALRSTFTVACASPLATSSGL